MGVIAGESQIPETFFGPGEAKPWWDPNGRADNAVYLDHDATSEEALVEAGLTWTASHRPLFFPDKTNDQPGDAPRFATATHRADRLMAIVRDTDDRFLGSSMPGFRIFQNAELADLGDALLGEGAYWHTGGSLYGGKIVWLLAKFDKTIHVKGDDSPIEDYLALINGFDGRHGCTVLTGMVRIVCGNTCAQSIAGATDKVTLRHVAGMDKRAEEVKQALNLHVQYRETLETLLNDLADRPMTIEDVRAFTEVLIPTPPDKERAPRLAAHRDLIVALFDRSPTLVGVPNTAYRAYQAVTEYADQYRPYRDTKLQRGNDRLALSVIEGPAYDLKSRAVRLLV